MWGTGWLGNGPQVKPLDPRRLNSAIRRSDLNSESTDLQPLSLDLHGGGDQSQFTCWVSVAELPVTLGFPA